MLESAACCGKRKPDINGRMIYQNKYMSLLMTIRRHCPRPNSPVRGYRTNGMTGDVIVSVPAQNESTRS